MHIYFSGIGGAGIGPLALIAKQAGYFVSGSDKKESQYTEYLKNKDIAISIGQTGSEIAEVHKKQPIDWLVYSSALPLENPNHPELLFAKENNIRSSKRDEFLNTLLKEKNQKLLAIAGTHGKTTATAMAIWVFNQLDISVNYSVGAKISFGDMSYFNSSSEFFIYECDEFDRNFLNFYPDLSVITTIDWDHHEIYPTRDEYKQAFRQFIEQSKEVIAYEKDCSYLDLQKNEKISQLNTDDELIKQITLSGAHNRKNAFVVANALSKLLDQPVDKIIEVLCEFPGTKRRFEKISTNVYSDYAHTPEEIAATLQMAVEINPDVIAVYEPLTNRRQYFMRDKYDGVFESAKKVYWLPSYLAREDAHQPVLTPDELIKGLSKKTNAEVAKPDWQMMEKIEKHVADGNLVLCMTGGGANSLDDFLRKHFAVQ